MYLAFHLCFRDELSLSSHLFDFISSLSALYTVVSACLNRCGRGNGVMRSRFCLNIYKMSFLRCGQRYCCLESISLASSLNFPPSLFLLGASPLASPSICQQIHLPSRTAITLRIIPVSKYIMGEIHGQKGVLQCVLTVQP